MRFKGKGDKKYNQRWNDEVVCAYKALINQFRIDDFFSKEKFEKSIEQYCTGVVTIVQDLTCEASQFEDLNNVENFIKKTKEEAIKDLKYFEAEITARYGCERQSCLDQIRETLQSLTKEQKVEASEATFPLEPELIYTSEAQLSNAREMLYTIFSQPYSNSRLTLDESILDDTNGCQIS